MAQGQLMSYEEVGIEKYQYVAALSERTCDTCGGLDGETFDVKDARPGDNYPPMHANCRCTTIMAGFTPATRIARDPETSKNYKVDGNMTFEEWKNSLTDEQQAVLKYVDKSAGNGIIKLGINLFDKSDPIYFDTFSIEEESGFKDVFLHGSSSSVQITQNGKHKNLSPKEFIDVLKQNGYTGGDIRLASCSTGAGDNSFAQQLSKELGVTVKAPDSDVYFIPEDGVLFVGSPYENSGKWRKFKNGVEIDD